MPAPRGAGPRRAQRVAGAAARAGARRALCAGRGRELGRAPARLATRGGGARGGRRARGARRSGHPAGARARDARVLDAPARGLRSARWPSGGPTSPWSATTWPRRGRLDLPRELPAVLTCHNLTWRWYESRARPGRSRPRALVLRAEAWRYRRHVLARAAALPHRGRGLHARGRRAARARGARAWS